MYDPLHKKSENPTDGSRWIIQILSKPTQKHPPSNPTNCRWWDSKPIDEVIGSRRDLNNPPTAVGGIF
jgi:hypothetical protein